LLKLAESVRLCEAEADATRGRLKAAWAQIDQAGKTHRERKLDLENQGKDLGARQEEMKEREERQRAEMCRLKTDAKCCAEEMTRRVEKLHNARAQARANGQEIRLTTSGKASPMPWRKTSRDSRLEKRRTPEPIQVSMVLERGTRIASEATTP
jgi:hypothetical protein